MQPNMIGAYGQITILCRDNLAGCFLAEDQQALNLLCAREDVDAERVG